MAVSTTLRLVVWLKGTANSHACACAELTQYALEDSVQGSVTAGAARTLTAAAAKAMARVERTIVTAAQMKRLKCRKK